MFLFYFNHDARSRPKETKHEHRVDRNIRNVDISDSHCSGGSLLLPRTPLRARKLPEIRLRELAEVLRNRHHHQPAGIRDPQPDGEGHLRSRTRRGPHRVPGVDMGEAIQQRRPLVQQAVEASEAWAQEAQATARHIGPTPHAFTGVTPSPIRALTPHPSRSPAPGMVRGFEFYKQENPSLRGV